MNRQQQILAAAAAMVLGLGGVVWWTASDDSGAKAVAAHPLGAATEPSDREGSDGAGSTTPGSTTPGSTTPGSTTLPADSTATTPGATLAETTIPTATTVPATLPPATASPTVAPTIPPTAPPTTPPTASPTAGVDTSGWVACTEPVDGWQVKYPADWFAYVSSDGPTSCKLFAPFDMSAFDYGTALQQSVIEIDRFMDDSLASERSNYLSAEGWESVPVMEDLTIAGRPALRVTAVVPAGARDAQRWGMYFNLIDVSNLSRSGVLMLLTTAPIGPDYDRAVAVTDAMITTLVLPPT
jgi:hypothetical protein